MLGIADLIRKKSIYRLGSPYSEMVNEILNLDTTGIEFWYRDTESRCLANMSVYHIDYDDIVNIAYDPDTMIFTLTGKGRLTVYDDFKNSRINDEKSQRRFLLIVNIRLFWPSTMPKRL